MAAKIPLTYESSVPAAPGVVVPFDTFAILPEAGDNAGICRKVTPKGTRFTLPGGSEVYELSHTCLEGHRFAVAHVAPGVHLKSWNLTFAFALKPILPGQYLANARVLAALRARGVTDLPVEPNMEDLIVPHEVNEAEFKAHEQVPLMVDAGATTFQGFAREGGRGVGTRNYIILVGTTSLAAGYVKALEAAAKKAGLLGGGTLDGIVAVAHTEGTGNREEGYRPHNYDLLCTTLAAFCVHPNVGAALLVDYGSNEEAVWGEEVVAKAGQAGMPLASVPYSHVRLTGDLQADLALGLERITHHLPTVQAAPRTPQPTSFLSVAQQCGGSDAFSGVSGNPCAGEACKLLIQFGGQAVLAETDELMGAESYILSKVKDLHTANKFMTLINNFKDRLSWHGQSAESNPSGGNNWRGLYNIGLKSLGAAKKKHADVALDGVLDYGERTVNMGRGYYFMDSPGNDLESIAGQVATGCNVIYFITGNGSITNFPFVPTIKIVTTTERFKLLEKDMDFNAGRYQEGTPMVQLGKELFDLTLKVSSGEYSVGERAGHAQVSIWRNWPQTGPTDVNQFTYGPKGGEGLVVGRGGASMPPSTLVPGYPGAAPRGNVAVERLGLILPTSLCSGEVARKITSNLNTLITTHPDLPLAATVSRFECLPHTEGCGTGYPDGGIEQYTRIMLGHLTHPSISLALCLEHGCEKTHNDFFGNALRDAGISTDGVGFASIQLDGGIEAVTGKVVEYFKGVASEGKGGGVGKAVPVKSRTPIDVRSLDLGLVVVGGEKGGSVDSPEIALAAAALVRGMGEGGGCVVIPATSPLLRNPLFTDALTLAQAPDSDSPTPIPPTLAFGESVRQKGGKLNGGGVHIMDVPYVRDYCEITTGLAATGVHAVLVLSTTPRKGTARPTPGHPLVPVVHVGLGVTGKSVDPAYAAAVDSVHVPGAGDTREAVALGLACAALETVGRVVGGEGAKAKSSATPFFSITRGPTGVST